MQVSFIIPLYNCLALTQAMLASLRATLPPGLTYEIIYVDDGSTDGTRAWLATLREPPFRVLLNERNMGYAAGNNRAAAVARGEFLALLNNDLELLPGWLEPMLAAHRELGGSAGLVGNVQLSYQSGAVDHAGIVINHQGKPVHLRSLPSARARRQTPVMAMPAVTGACLLVERALWQQLGGFDEAYLNGGEDIDLAFRARVAGRINVAVLNSVVRHHVSASPGRKLRDEQNSRRLMRRWWREFASATPHAVQAWCREYLRLAVITPDSAEYRLTLHAGLYIAGWRQDPPPAALAGVEAAQAREFARWDEMFGA